MLQSNGSNNQGQQRQQPQGNYNKGQAPGQQGHEYFQGGPDSGQGEGGEEGGQDQNLQALMQYVQQQNQELESLKSQHKQNSSLLDGLKNLFTGKEEKPDPLQSFREKQDYYLQTALQAERDGNPIPLTANLATDFYDSQITQAEKEQALMQEIQELKKQVSTLKDPRARSANEAYRNIDNLISKNIDKIYGHDDSMMQVKETQFNAVATTLSNQIKEIQKNHPDVWAEIERSPDKQERLVSAIVSKSLPPKVRQMIEDDHVKRTPMADGELLQAFAELKQMPDDFPDKAKIMGQLRQEILMRKYNRNNPRQRA